MAINVLSQASAFNPGADLWVIPNFENSKWTARIDWYLNFQIIKSTRRKPKLIEPFLTEIISQTNLKLQTADFTENQNTLIPADKTLPARWVYVHRCTEVETWVGEIQKTWQRLGEPTLKVFLPSGLSAGQFSELWQKVNGSSDLTLVLD